MCGTGCRDLGNLAAAGAMVAATSFIGAGVAAAISDEVEAACRPKSDVRRRIWCPEGRSWKLRCPTDIPCFFEDSDGRAYPCPTAACDEPPEDLVAWCR